VARLDFANSRLGARRARLAGEGAMRELLARPSLEARLELLRGLPLGAALPAVAGAPAPPLGEVERALREALRHEALALVDDAEGERPRALLRAYLQADEGEVVKAVLRGVARGAGIDETLAAAPPVPGIPEAGLRRAAAAGSVEAALEALAATGSAVAADVRGAGPERTGESLLPLEICADRAALGRARAACRRGGEDGAVLARHLADRADVRNASTLLLSAGASPVASPWVPGGRRFAEDALDALARAGAEQARAAVEEGFPGVGRALARPWTAERALERAVLANLRREARQRPLSLAVPLAYLAARRDEVRRVALVLRGAALELPGEEILDLVEA
jgi:V/A-type H+-transporting ATPase subunit C